MPASPLPPSLAIDALVEGVYIVRVEGGQTTHLPTEASLNPQWSPR